MTKTTLAHTPTSVTHTNATHMQMETPPIVATQRRRRRRAPTWKNVNVKLQRRLCSLCRLTGMTWPTDLVVVVSPSKKKKKIMSCRSHICRILLFFKLFTLLWAESNRNFDLFVKELSGFTSSSLRSIFHLPTPLLRGLIIGMACPYRVTQTRREKKDETELK